MKKLISITVFLMGVHSLMAQRSMEFVLSQVESNNPVLKALRLNMEAEKIGNRTGLTPDNPQIGFGFLGGKPSAIGNRQDVNIEQSFDFPTAYIYRNQIAGIRSSQVDLEFQKERKEILFHAKTVCIELIYMNALKAEYSRRVAHAGQIARAYRMKFEAGESSLLESNKAEMNLSEAIHEVEHTETGQKELLAELATLNGGMPVEMNDTIFPAPVIPADFDQWYAQVEPLNPGLTWLSQETNANRKEEKLSVSLAMPGLSAGYMSEKVVGEHFRGITAGVTIPLWADKNRIRYAKAKTIAARQTEEAIRAGTRQNLKALYDKAVQIRKISDEYRSRLTKYDNSELLMKALTQGEIPLIEYILELSFYYQSREKLLSMEREMHLVLAEMHKFE